MRSIIKDNYSGREFSSIQEYDQFRRSSEYKLLKREHITKWIKKYECMYGDASFDNKEDLLAHYGEKHPDQIQSAINEIQTQKILRRG